MQPWVDDRSITRPGSLSWPNRSELVFKYVFKYLVMILKILPPNKEKLLSKWPCTSSLFIENDRTIYIMLSFAKILFEK